MGLWRVPPPPVQVSNLPEDLQALVPAYFERLARRPRDPEPAPEGDLHCGCPREAAVWDGEAWVCASCSGLPRSGVR